VSQAPTPAPRNIAPGPPPLSLTTRVLFSVGAVANYIKLRSLSTFLLIFYNQAVGLPPTMVAAAISIALLFDAFVDPAIGVISDNTRTPWGRRHPFMYAAALPVSLAFLALWNPPADWDNAALFGYLLGTLLVIRLFDTFFELPSQSLVPELAPGYNERTKLLSLRMAFGVVGGLTMTLLGLQVFMKETEGGGGITERAGYFEWSVLAALVIFSAILISTASTHHRIPYLRQAPTRKLTVLVFFKELFQTLNNRAFVIATVAGMFIAVAGGAKNGLDMYFNIYFFELKQTQLSVMLFVGVAGTLIGVTLAPLFVARFGKKHAAIICFASALVVGLAPIVLRLMGLAPPNGTAALFALVLGETLINTAFAVATAVILVSMIADVVEDSEVKTGRRSEGLLFSADNLFKKAVSGLGVVIAANTLAFAGFPQDAKRGAVDPEVLQSLGLVYVPVALGIYGIAILTLFLFPIDRARHESNLARLRETALATEEAALADDPLAEAGVAPAPRPA
jgi:glycoside/pentoside/hexuronide:cation symporter, GPH family